VFKVKYDGREIPCDYTEPVFPGISNVNKNITVEAKLICPPTNYMTIKQMTELERKRY